MVCLKSTSNGLNPDLLREIMNGVSQGLVYLIELNERLKPDNT